MNDARKQLTGPLPEMERWTCSKSSCERCMVEASISRSSSIARGCAERLSWICAIMPRTCQLMQQTDRFSVAGDQSSKVYRQVMWPR